MKINDIIEEALTDKWYDKLTGEEYIKTPIYELYDNIIHIKTFVKPYRLVVLRRLLNKANITYGNIIIGYPNRSERMERKI